MKIPRWLPIVALVAIGAGAIACEAEGDLNPQPLPPGGEDKSSGSSGASSGETSSSGYAAGGSSSGGSSSGSNATPDNMSDAGAPYDAGGDAADASDAEIK